MVLEALRAEELGDPGAAGSATGCIGDAVRLIGRALARSVVGIVSVGVLTAAVATSGWAGEPVAAPASRKAVAPPAPVVVHGAPADGSVVLWWVPPRAAVARPITDYLIQSSTNGGRSWKRVKDGVSAEPTATVTGLRNGRAYRFRVAAVAGKRKSHYSLAGSRVTPRPVDCAHPGPRTNLAGCDLEGLTQVDLSGSNLKGARLFGSRPSRLVGAYVEAAGLTTADFHGLDVRGSNFARAGLSDVDLSGANLRGISARRASTYNAGLQATDIRDADLTGISIYNLVVGVRFDRSIMTGCSFPDNGGTTGIVGVDFTGADLSGCGLQGAQVRRGGSGPSALTFGMRLGGADLTGTDFSSAKLRALDLEGADLSKIITTDLFSFGGNTGRPRALPPSWQSKSGFLVGPGVNLRGDASGADLRGVDLTEADFGFPSIASAGNANLAGADLSGANLTGVSGEGAVLDRAKLVRANLTGAWFAHSSLISADATGANLTRADFSSSDLSRMSFAGADLTDGGLEGVKLEGADLRTATLTSVRSSELTGVPLLPDGWAVVDGSLVRRA